MEYRSAISIVAAGAIAVLTFTPEHVWAEFPAVCAFRVTLGIECLGCGMTRALAALAHGDAARATTLNPGVLLVAPLLAIGALQGIYRR